MDNCSTTGFLLSTWLIKSMRMLESNRDERNLKSSFNNIKISSRLQELRCNVPLRIELLSSLNCKAAVRLPLSHYVQRKLDLRSCDFTSAFIQLQRTPHTLEIKCIDLVCPKKLDICVHISGLLTSVSADFVLRLPHDDYGSQCF